MHSAQLPAATTHPSYSLTALPFFRTSCTANTSPCTLSCAAGHPGAPFCPGQHQTHPVGEMQSSRRRYLHSTQQPLTCSAKLHAARCPALNSCSCRCISACETRALVFSLRSLDLLPVGPASLGRIPLATLQRRCRCPHIQSQLSSPPPRRRGASAPSRPNGSRARS